MTKPAKRVLIYRLGSLGDTLVALPSLHLIARAFPDAERRMLTNIPVSSKAPAAAAILKDTGLVHSYFRYVVGTRNLLELLSLWFQLMVWRPEVVINLASARGIAAARRDSKFFRLCGISRQIGFPLTEDMQQCRLEGPARELEPEASRLARNLAVLGDARLDDPRSWDLRLTTAETARAAEVLTAAEGLPILAVSVGTKVQSKDWGKENWRALLAAVAERYPGYALALCGAPEEAEASEFAAEGWRNAASASGPVINVCGRLTPRESAAVFARARLFIGHDSGPMHLAAAVQTPCVAIFAARNKPRMWFPYGHGHRVIYHQVDCWGCGLETCIVQKKKCITSITVEEVLSQVVEVMDAFGVTSQGLASGSQKMR